MERYQGVAVEERCCRESRKREGGGGDDGETAGRWKARPRVRRRGRRELRREGIRMEGRSVKEQMDDGGERREWQDTWAEKGRVSRWAGPRLETGEGHGTMANGVAAQRSQ